MENFLSLGILLLSALYVLSALLYVRLFFEEESVSSHATLSLQVLLVLQCFWLLGSTLAENRLAVATASGGLLFGAWLVSLAHYISEKVAHTAKLGMFTLLPCAAPSVFAAIL